MTIWQDIPGNSASIDAIYGPAVDEAKDGDVFVELGVFYGRSLAMLCRMAADAGKKLDVTGVDLWEDGGAITLGAAPHAYAPAKFEACRQWLADVGAHPRLVKGDTAEYAGRVDDGSVALAFIDGDHSYCGARRDIAAWWPKIKRGGMLAGHDYSDEYRGVMQAVTAVFPQYRHHAERDTGICWWVRKP